MLTFRVDKLLSGGLYTCEVMELYGPSGAGKTQLALQIAALSCFKHRVAVMYMDTCNCFSSARFVEILHNYSTDEQVNNFQLRTI